MRRVAELGEELGHLSVRSSPWVPLAASLVTKTKSLSMQLGSCTWIEDLS